MLVGLLSSIPSWENWIITIIISISISHLELLAFKANDAVKTLMIVDHRCMYVCQFLHFTMKKRQEERNGHRVKEIKKKENIFTKSMFFVALAVKKICPKIRNNTSLFLHISLSLIIYSMTVSQSVGRWVNMWMNIVWIIEYFLIFYSNTNPTTSSLFIWLKRCTCAMQTAQPTLTYWLVHLYEWMNANVLSSFDWIKRKIVS